MGHGRAITVESDQIVPPLPADLVGQLGETAGSQLTLSGLPLPDRHTTFAALALGASLANVIGGAHLPGTGQETQEPWVTDAATTSLTVSATADHAPSQPRPQLTTVRIHEGQTFWGIEQDEHLPHGLLEEANPHLIPNAIPANSPIRTVPTGAVNEIAAAHHESHDAAAFEILISAEGGRTWHNGPGAEIPRKGDGVLLHEAGSGYYSGAVERIFKDSTGRHYAQIHIIELDETVIVRTADSQRLIEFGSFTQPPTHSTGHAHRPGTAPGASTAAARTHRSTPAASPTAAATGNPGRTAHPGARTPSVTPSAATTSPNSVTPTVGSPSPLPTLTPAPEATLSPAAGQATGTQGESDPSAPGSSTAVTPDLGRMLDHPATLTSIETSRPHALAARIILDAFYSSADATPSPAPSVGDTTTPGAAVSTSPSAAATGEATQAQGSTGTHSATSPAVAPDLGFLQDGPASKTSQADIPGTPGYQPPSTQASSSPSAAASQEQQASSEYQHQQQIRARITANGWKLNAQYGGQAEPSVVQSFSQHGPEEWCADLVEYLRHISGAPTFDGTALQWPADDNPRVGGANSIEAAAAANDELWTFVPGGRFPEPGDNVIFGSPGYHIETVLERHGDTIITIGGDTLPRTASGDLAMRIHKFNLSSYNNDIAAFVSLFPLNQIHAGRTPHTHPHPHPTTSPSASATSSPQTGNTIPGSLADIPGAVSPGLGTFAVFNIQAKTSPNTASSTESGQADIPGAISPNLSWLGGQSGQDTQPSSPHHPDTSPPSNGRFEHGMYVSGEKGPYTVEMFNRHLLTALALYTHTPIDQVLTKEHMYALAAWEDDEKGDLAWDNYGYFNLLNAGLNDPSLLASSWNGSGLEAFKSMDAGIQALLYVFTGTGPSAQYQTRMGAVLTRPSSAEEVLDVAAEFWKTPGNLGWAGGPTPNDAQSVVTFNEYTYKPDLLSNLSALRAGGYHRFAKTQIGFGQHGQNVVSDYHVQY